MEDWLKLAVSVAWGSGHAGIAILILIAGVTLIIFGPKLAGIKLPRPTPAPEVDEGGPVSPGTVVNSDPKPPEDHGG